ncbi:MAG TPA: MerR family transcriptional regulator [Candidatus Nanopelagicales bacterium]|nr:MerR family transcriptional regulator [Candidatus Nanopelagicales bacterium]
MEELSIAVVARLTGVSSRTLRHYDDIGLVPPARIGSNGYRYYGRAQLQRLQEVLVLRELGLGLAAIDRVLGAGGDRAASLREHRAALLTERDRLTRLADTVGRSIEELEGGAQMSAQERFDGVAATRYEDEVVARWGRTAYDDGQARWAELGPEGRAAHQAEHDAIVAGLAAALAAGVGPGEDQVQALVGRHHRWVSTFWTPDRAAYVGLGRMYVEDPRFTRSYDEHGEGTAVLLRDAIEVWAERRLG